jgi:hypothetical protein
LLLGERVSWTSDKDGFLGIGDNLLVDLRYGDHLITIQIDDSNGNEASKSINIFIGSKLFLPFLTK